MSYKPNLQEVELDILFSKKIDEMMSSIKQVGSMYVEPGDVILVKVNDDADDETLNFIKKVMSNTFKENPGFFLTNDIDIQVLRRSEEFKEGISQIEKLKNAIQELEARISELEMRHLVSNEKT